MRQSSAAFGFVLVTVALDLLAMGITVPVLPQLILRLLKGDTEAAVLGFGALGAVWALMQWAPDGADDIALANQYVGVGLGSGVTHPSCAKLTPLSRGAPVW